MIKFNEFVNEIKTKAKAVHSSKPQWDELTIQEQGKYIDRIGINLRGKNLKEIPFQFPDKYEKTFSCYDNKITTLEGCPKEIGGNFVCQLNKLGNLIGGPLKVTGNYSCSNNPLTSLEGIPTILYGDFYCNNTTLNSLRYFPTEIYGNLYCYNNTRKFTEVELRSICHVRKKVVVEE